MNDAMLDSYTKPADPTIGVIFLAVLIAGLTLGKLGLMVAAFISMRANLGRYIRGEKEKETTLLGRFAVLMLYIGGRV